MSSAIVAWKGKCPERAVQDELLAFVRLLARENEARWAKHPTPQSPFPALLSQQRSEGLPQLPNVREFNQEITGLVVLCSDLFSDREAFRAEAARCGLSCEPFEGSRNPTLTALTLDRLTVRGIERTADTGRLGRGQNTGL
jgi:hypothetical protein